MSEYLRYYYKNVNPLASEEEVANFVATNTREYDKAEGGRIGYALGSVTGYASRSTSEPDWYKDTNMYKLGEEYYAIIKTFLVYLNRIPDTQNTGIFGTGSLTQFSRSVIILSD